MPANIRLGWNGLTGTNTLAFNENSKLTAVKSFTTLAAGVLNDPNIWLDGAIVAKYNKII